MRYDYYRQDAPIDCARTVKGEVIYTTVWEWLKDEDGLFYTVGSKGIMFPDYSIHVSGGGLVKLKDSVMSQAMIAAGWIYGSIPTCQ
jgi:hypothetical protein